MIYPLIYFNFLLMASFGHFSHTLYKKNVSPRLKQISVNEFLMKTSIPGISHISKQGTVWGKIIWIGFFTATILMSIYQSWGLINDYFDYKLYVQSKLKLNSTLPLPAFTMCNSNPVRWRDIQNSTTFASNIKMAYEKMLKKLHLTDDTIDNKDKKQLKEWLLLQQMRENSFKSEYEIEDIYFQRILLIPYIIYHFVVYGNDSTEFHDFIHPFYGTCTTINSGIKKDVDVTYVDPTEDILIGLFGYDNQNPSFLNRPPGLILIVHEPKTPPVFTSGSVNYIPPGQFVQLRFSLTNINRLPAPYPSKCIDNTDMNYRSKMVFYNSFNTPYLYSTEACISTYEQNKTIEDPRFRCVNPKIPTFPHQKENVCYFAGAKLKGLKPNLEIDKRDCPLVCKENKYTIYYSLKPFSLSKYYEDAMEVRLATQFEVYGNVTRKDFKKIGRRNFVIINGFWNNAFYEELMEVPKYTVAGFWGAVGGNVSLWTGISVLSFIELLNVIITYCKLKQVSSHKMYNNLEPSNLPPRKYGRYYY